MGDGTRVEEPVTNQTIVENESVLGGEDVDDIPF